MLLALTLLLSACGTATVPEIESPIADQQKILNPYVVVRALCEESGGSCKYVYEDKDANLLPLPQQVQDILAKSSPEEVDESWSFSPDLKWLVFLDWSDYSVRIWNVETSEETVLMNLKKPGFGAFNIEFFGWNYTGDKLGFVVRSGDIGVKTTTYVLEVNQGTLTSEKTYEVPVIERCEESVCDFGVEWFQENSLIYQPMDSEWTLLTDFGGCKKAVGCAEIYDL